MTDPRDSHTLQRFTQAQRDCFDTALGELHDGRKRTHWMWFVFPQIDGLGRSSTARFYAIRSLGEARAFLAHPLLGPRLRQSTEALLAWSGKRSAEAILGSVDAMKLRSSLTLFHAASGDPLFERALVAFFPDGPDPATLELLGPGAAD